MFEFILELLTCWMFAYVVYSSCIVMSDCYQYYKYRTSHNTYRIYFELKDNFSILKDCTNKNTTQVYYNVL